jgi:hypothetical protein
VLAMDFRHCQILDPVGDAVAFPKSIEFWKDRRISAPESAEFRSAWLLNRSADRFTEFC